MNEKGNVLSLIPKAEKYIQYIIEMILKITRTEKYSIGTEYKLSIYKMLESIIGLNKIEEKRKLCNLNNIDTELNLQRISNGWLYKNRKNKSGLPYTFRRITRSTRNSSRSSIPKQSKIKSTRNYSNNRT